MNILILKQVMMNKSYRGIVIILLLVFVTPWICAQGNNSEAFYLFGSEEVLEVSLKFDMTNFMKEKPDEEYMDAELVYHFSKNDSLVNKIRVRSRGNSRYEMCILPPIRLNFKNCDNRPLDLKGVSNVKLVTHCKDNKNFEDYVLKEYLAYRMYNVVSDTSFRVRLLHIKYIDKGSKGYDCYRYGFVIEPLDVLTARLNSLEKEDVTVRPAFIDSLAYDRLCLFQYMIGNDDWNLANLHNLKLIEPREGSKTILSVVPYDFDYAGLVEAYYAIPNPLYGLEDIMQRIYIGPCRSDQSLQRLLSFFSDHKADFYSEIDKISFINKNQKKKVSRYIDSFYEEYKRDRIFYNIKKTCTR